MLRDCPPSEVEPVIRGRPIEAVERQGKFLLVPLSGDVFLTFHLGMTGKLLILPGCPQEQSRHSRFLFRLDDQGETPVALEFRDMRKFGRLHVTTGGPARRLGALGPDAWKGDWDAKFLGARLSGRRSPIKAFLLDQRQLAGIGNIYADEILWLSALAPTRPCASLSRGDLERLADAIRQRLEEGVRLMGCSISDFVDTEGHMGGFQFHLKAYGRQGRSCTRCGDKLIRVTVAGRGTAYCPGCQR